MSGELKIAAYQHYRLCFGDDGKRVDFEARGITRALALAANVIGQDRSATLYEDGIAIGRLTSNNFSLFQDHCRPVALDRTRGNQDLASMPAKASAFVAPVS